MAATAMQFALQPQGWITRALVMWVLTLYARLAGVMKAIHQTITPRATSGPPPCWAVAPPQFRLCDPTSLRTHDWTAEGGHAVSPFITARGLPL